MRGVLLDPRTGRPETDPLDTIIDLVGVEEQTWKQAQARLAIEGGPQAMDGPFFNDLRAPFMTADQAAVTLAATDKAMYTSSAHPVNGGQYWWQGKKVVYRAFGKITTAATPGNLTVSIYYGTGADANGVILAASAAQTLIAAQTNISWEIEFRVSCRTTGNAGTLFVDGHATFGTAVIAVGTFLIPASAAVVSGAVDLTAANIITVQFKRSGSTVETATTQDFEVIALN